ncbi:hypothetical protein ACFLIM_33220 [Nonomuraea sp. M3C6]|uniref:Uncharacterized protein n=1 Tax=Nonomuraea marmarensis TaxID=3351344 RepID=A0ABW7AL22_9ACTN
MIAKGELDRAEAAANQPINRLGTAEEIAALHHDNTLLREKLAARGGTVTPLHRGCGPSSRRPARPRSRANPSGGGADARVLRPEPVGGDVGFRDASDQRQGRADALRRLHAIVACAPASLAGSITAADISVENYMSILTSCPAPFRIGCAHRY